MATRCIALSALCVVGLSMGPCCAASAPLPAGLISGEMRGAYSGGGTTWCAVMKGASFIQRTGSNPRSPAVIVFPELTYHDGPSDTTYVLDGQARLGFSDSTSGKIAFANGSKPSITASFNAYDIILQKGGSYLLVINIFFPDGCALAVQATYAVPS